MQVVYNSCIKVLWVCSISESVPILHCVVTESMVMETVSGMVKIDLDTTDCTIGLHSFIKSQQSTHSFWGYNKFVICVMCFSATRCVYCRLQ
jgi:hypothetical protein